MARRYASFFPQRINMWHKNSAIGSHGATNSPHIATFDFGVPNASDADAILAARSIDPAGSTTTFAAAYVATEAQMGRWGRNVTVACSGTGTSVVRVFGRDYMGQPMREHLTLNDSATALGVRAFRYIDEVDWDLTASRTINLGLGNYLGLPYKCFSMVSEIKNSVVAANAGTFVAGLASTSPANATSIDPRGLYLPITVIPNGSVRFEIRCTVDPNNLLGNQHYYASL